MQPEQYFKLALRKDQEGLKQGGQWRHAACRSLILKQFRLCHRMQPWWRRMQSYGWRCSQRRTHAGAAHPQRDHWQPCSILWCPVRRPLLATLQCPGATPGGQTRSSPQSWPAICQVSLQGSDYTLSCSYRDALPPCRLSHIRHQPCYNLLIHEYG